MSMQKFQGLFQKDEGCNLFKALRELTRVETGVVRDVGWGPWS